MKVALLTDGVYPYVIGGMQKHSYYLCKYLVQSGNEVTLVHCLPEGEKLPSGAEVKLKLDLAPEYEKNLTVVTLNFPKPGKIPGHYLTRSKAYSKTIYEELKPQLSSFYFIYAKGFTAWHLLEQKSKGIKMPPVGVKFHGYEMFQTAPSFRVKLEHLMLQKAVKYNTRNADVVFSYGGKITPIIKGIGAREIIEIPSAIETGWLRTEPLTENKNTIQFLFLGRYERRKGIEELNMVIQKLGENFQASFHFIGPIPEGKKLHQKNVVYHGVIMDKNKIQQVMAKCDVLLCPSHSEGMPNVILEAMARGLAVIASDVGAVSELVDSSNGWLVEANNIVRLEEVVNEATRLSSEEMKTKKSISIQKIETDFTWDKIIINTISEIKRFIVH